MSILILGLPGAGKTTLAGKLSEKLRYKVISVDRHRYGPGWTHLDFDTMYKTITDELDDGKPKIIESVYTTHDKDRKKIIDLLIPVVSKIYIIKPEPLEVIVAQLIDRCIDRAILSRLGLPTVCESSQNRAHLIINSIEKFDDDVSTLYHLGSSIDPKILMLPRESLEEILL